MLWCGYAREVLNLNLNPNSKSLTNPNITPNSNLSLASLGPKIASLDLHGALVRVVKSGCPSLVGCWGICVRECKFSLVLVDERCFVRRVGKRGVVFAVDIPVPVPASGSRSGSGSGSRSRGEGVVGFDEEEKGSDADVDVDVDVFRKGSENAGDDGGRIGRITIEISGSAIECRPVDRATKKFKGRKYDGF